MFQFLWSLIQLAFLPFRLLFLVVSFLFSLLHSIFATAMLGLSCGGMVLAVLGFFFIILILL